MEYQFIVNPQTNRKCRTDSKLGKQIIRKYLSKIANAYNGGPVGVETLSAALADQMSKMSIAKGKSTAAVKFAHKAIEMEENANQKAIYYLALADAYRNAGSYASARVEAYNALELRSGWGEAYMNLGNIYISGAKSCGSDFDNSTVYWVAVDSFKKALSDEETKDRASKSINTYSKYFPTKEKCFFNGVEQGKSHTVGCWINKTTMARPSD